MYGSIEESLVYGWMRRAPRQANGQNRWRQGATGIRSEVGSGARASGRTTGITMLGEGLWACRERDVKSGALGMFLAGVEAGRIAAGSVLVVEGLDRLSRAGPIQAQAQRARL